MAHPDHLAMLDQGREAWNAWRADNPTLIPDLSGVVLSDRFVTNANSLAEAYDLSLCRFDDADLSNANLVRADLRAATFLRTGLRDANLRFSRLADAVFDGADAVGIDLRDADIEGLRDFRPARITCPMCESAEVDLSHPHSDGPPLTTWHCAPCGWFAMAPGRLLAILETPDVLRELTRTAKPTERLNPLPWLREHTREHNPAHVDPCPFCNNPAFRVPGGQEQLWTWCCRVCGHYELEPGATWLDELAPETRVRLMWYLREAFDDGRVTRLSARVASLIADSVAEPADPFECIHRLMDWLYRHSKPGGAKITLTGWEFPVAFARDRAEFHYLVQQAVETTGWIEGRISQSSPRVRLTLNGWKHMAERGQRRRNPRQAFVAMGFAPELDPVWESLRGAIEDAGLQAVRLDKLQHNDKICDRIIAEIRKSGLLIADCTNASGNVYFEAGFAMGLDLPVIWTCKASLAHELEFDTRQYAHILWDSPEDLRTKLLDRLEATLVHLTGA